MNGLDRGQILTALTLLVMALFVSSGMPGLGRWRRPIRLAAIGLFAICLAYVIVEVVVWLSIADR